VALVPVLFGHRFLLQAKARKAFLFEKKVTAQVGGNVQRRAKASSRKRFFFEKKEPKNLANSASVSPGEPKPK
jgi:hypothetical protein